MKSLAQLDVRIIVQGRDGTDPRNPARFIHLLAAEQHGRYLLIQVPSRTILAECDALSIGEAIVSRLPEAKPGHLVGEDAYASLAGLRSARFRAPVVCAGVIQVIGGRSVAWKDLDGDGRYAITLDTRPVARPIDAAGLAEMVNIPT